MLTYIMSGIVMGKKKKKGGRRKWFGLFGKGGAILATVPPLAISAATAGNAAYHKSGMGMFDKVVFFGLRYINDIVAGTIGLKPFGKVTIGKTMGVEIGESWGGEKPFLGTLAAGSLMMIIDACVSKFSGKSVRVAGVSLIGRG